MRLREPFALPLAIAMLHAVLLSAPPVHAAEPSDEAGTEASTDSTWTPELTLLYQGLRQTALSADGSRVAYTVRQPEIEGERSEYVERIHVATADGSLDVPYTQAERSSTSPAFSPDGNYLAFLSKASADPEAKRQIWVMRVLGGEADPITDAESDITSFKWSPDGRHLAYLMADPLSDEERKEKKEKRDVILVNQNFKYQHLHVVPAAADEHAQRESRRITEGNFHVTAFDWSPDGERWVIAHQADPRINTGFLDRDLSLVAVSDGARSVLVEQSGVDANPHFSPDGRHVAFTSHGGRPELIGLADVYVVEATPGAQPRRLAETPDRNATLIGWSGDGSEVLVSESRGTTTQIVALAADGSKARDVSSIDGEIRAVSISRQGDHLAFAGESFDEPPEVHWSALDGFAPRRLTSHHEHLPRPAMGATELLTWPSTDGRFQIDGLLTRPVGWQGRPVPLILQIHGGPAGKFGRRFTGRSTIYPTQVFAQQGYAVLRPNPRGSIGYGKEFRYANVRDWGQGDFEDLMAGVDKAISMGIADPDRLFVMGWSYGGYMTSYLVTRTDRFRAASVGAGLPNLVSMVHTTDIGDYLVAHMGGVELWEDLTVYQKHSAIHRIDKVVTPTQVLHGARDLRVPLDQGRELFVALERRGVPTEMVVYPRTPHGVQEPKLILDVPKRILAWFARHGGLPYGGDETEDEDDEHAVATGTP